MPRRDLPFRLPVDARMGVNGGRCGNPPQRYPRKRPTVGAGSSRFSRRFPRPSQYTYTMPPTETPVFITTRHAASLSGLHASHLWNPMVFTTMRRQIATRCAASLQTPFPHMRMRAPPPPYARTMPHMETPVFTTTRHAASLRSSNNCKCLIETFFIARGKALSVKD